MKYSILLLFTLLGLPQANAYAQADATDAKVEIVHQLLDAFNAHDPEKMAEMVTENVKWLSVANGATSVDVEGRSSLVTAMKEYFAACPSCRSTLSKSMPSQDRVSVVEVATWRTQSGLQSQQSMAVYEFSGGQIEAVYYFPAESVPPAETEAKPE